MSGKLELLKWGVVSLAIPLAAGVHGHFQGEAVRDAEIARRDADLLLKLMPELNSGDPEKAGMAQRIVFGLDNTPSASVTIREMASHLRQVAEAKRRSDQAPLAREGALIAEAEALADPLVGRSAPATPPPSTRHLEAAPATAELVAAPSRVFIQIYAEEQRAAAEAVRESLRRRGVAVPAIENVLARATDPARVRRFAQRGAVGVRYFNRADAAAAAAVANSISAQTGSADVGVQDASRSGAGVPAGQLEIWFPLGG